MLCVLCCVLNYTLKIQLVHVHELFMHVEMFLFDKTNLLKSLQLNLDSGLPFVFLRKHDFSVILPLSPFSDMTTGRF